MSDTATRVSNANDVLGHQHYRNGPKEWREEHSDQLPVEEDVHFTTLAHTHWGDYLVPTVVRWAHGETDDFSDKEESLKMREEAEEAVAEGAEA